MLNRFLNWLFPPPKQAPASPRKPASVFDLQPEDWRDPERRRHAEQLIASKFKGELRVYDPLAGTTAMDDGDGGVSLAKGVGRFGFDTVPEVTLTWYATQGFLGYQICSLIAQHWLVNNACEVPARDAMRHWFSVTRNDGQELDPATIHKITEADKRMGLKSKCIEMVHQSRVFGIRIAMFKVRSDNPNYYEYPFNPDGVTPGSYEGIVQIDPYWCSPELSSAGSSDPTSPMFYEPTWWVINGRRVHHTHLVIMRGPMVADLLKPSYLYGGLSIPQMIYERVYAAERTANEAPLLALTKRATVMYTDLDKAVADEGNFVKKLQAWIRFRDNMGVKVVGHGDKIEQIDTSLSDMDALILSQYQLCAAIAKMPVTKLMGTAVKGMNATGEYDEATYHETLETVQTDITPLINRHHMLLMRSEISPADPFAVSIAWEPLDSPTAKERAETNLINAQTGAALVQSGAIDGTDERARITADKRSGYTGLAEVVNEDPASGIGETGALDGALFDPVAGTFADALLITNQSYLDDAIVAEKIVAGDFTVQVSPEFMDSKGKRFRVVLDGHHSLAAAVRAGQQPMFEETGYADTNYRGAISGYRCFDGK